MAWDIRGPEGFASILIGDTGRWPLTVRSDVIGVAPSGGPLFTLTAVYVSLWQAVVFFAGGAGLSFWLRPRHVPAGHCASGYDLRGVSSPRCPECGAARLTFLNRVLSAVARVFSRPARACRIGTAA